MEEKTYTGNDIVKMIFGEKRDDFEGCIIKGDVNIYRLERPDSVLNFSGISIEGNIDIGKTNINRLILKDASIQCLTIKNSTILQIDASNLYATDLYVEAIQIKELILKKAHIDGDVQIENSKIFKMYLAEMEYEDMLISNLNMAIAAQLSLNSIIVPTCKEKYNWLIQGMVRTARH